MVVNLDLSSKEGSHWVAIFAKKSNHVLYFDSYGKEPRGEILKYMKDNFGNIQRNLNSFQSEISLVCGHYCIYFIYCMSCNVSFINCLKLLKLSNCSDLFVKNFVDSFVQ